MNNMKTKKISIEVTVSEGSTLFAAVKIWQRKMNSVPYEEWKGVQAKNTERQLDKLMKAGL